MKGLSDAEFEVLEKIDAGCSPMDMTLKELSVAKRLMDTGLVEISSEARIEESGNPGDDFTEVVKDKRKRHAYKRNEKIRTVCERLGSALIGVLVALGLDRLLSLL